MLTRADSSLVSSESARFPAWARSALTQTEAETAFLAGSALARLNAIVRANPPWAGVFRRRLALAAAVASVSAMGRAEDETGLRDALHLTRPGGDPGPAGRHLLAWRALASRPAAQWRGALSLAADHLQVGDAEAIRAALECAESCLSGDRLAPFAAAQARELAMRTWNARVSGGVAAEILAVALADCVLAKKLNWPFVLPLLTDLLKLRAGRRRLGDEAIETRFVLIGYARAAERACDLAADLESRAQKLAIIRPKLRAKGASRALDGLLDDDCTSAATKIPGLSERGARRLFDRLQSLGAVREMTGRTTFRLYGL